MQVRRTLVRRTLRNYNYRITGLRVRYKVPTLGPNPFLEVEVTPVCVYYKYWLERRNYRIYPLHRTSSPVRLDN